MQAGRQSNWRKDQSGTWLAASAPIMSEKQEVQCTPQPSLRVARPLTIRAGVKTVQVEPVNLQFVRSQPQSCASSGKTPRSPHDEEIQNLRNQLKCASKELRVHLLKRLNKMEAETCTSFDETTASVTEDNVSVASLSSFSISPENMESRLQFTSP